MSRRCCEVCELYALSWWRRRIYHSRLAWAWLRLADAGEVLFAAGVAAATVGAAVVAVLVGVGRVA